MTKWREEVNEDGEVYIIFDDNYQVYFGDMEDVDKEEFEIIHLIVVAPELLEVCQEAIELLPAAMWIIDDKGGHSDIVDKLQALQVKLIKVTSEAKNEIPFTDEISEEIGLDW
jgi:hypothetical protein